MTSLGECLHFNMKNILTWFSSKSHLNMLWFHMKLSHFDSPEPLSARIHLVFSFLQRGTCSVRAHIVELCGTLGPNIRIPKADDQELPSLWRTLWIRPRSMPTKDLWLWWLWWAMEKSTERRVLSVLSYGILYTCFMFLFWRVTGHTALSTPIKETRAPAWPPQQLR